MDVRAYQTGEYLQRRAVQERYGGAVQLKDPLVVRHGEGKYAAYFRYGVVVLWGCDREEEKKLLAEVADAVRDPLPETVEERIEVDVREGPAFVTGKTVYIPKLDVSRIALISLVLSRSVALERHEVGITQAVREFEHAIADLERFGVVRISTRSILKRAGAAMSRRHAILHQIAMLDVPDLTWEDEALFALYKDLLTEYDIAERHGVLEQKLQMLFDYVNFILQYVEHRKTFWLEVIIVVLILVEILLVL